MSFSNFVLWLHIVSGFTVLLLGLVAMSAQKKPGVHTRAGEMYHGSILVTCLLASALSFLDWDRIWWFLPIAVGSYAFGFVGYLAAKVRWKNWLRWHVSGQGGSYIAMTTALLVVNWQAITGTPGVRSPLAWTLPTLIGATMITWVNIGIRKRQAGNRAS